MSLPKDNFLPSYFNDPEQNIVTFTMKDNKIYTDLI